ncbi:hypothetical protein ACJMK2_020613 [Sinanodonta woodiana]|uniref:protein-tyrosine-phosphatase n=1 Tax=Sinanodonta woodiana TaxID=1069815 RepID=A0ABD3U2E8_SINWO
MYPFTSRKRFWTFYFDISIVLAYTRTTASVSPSDHDGDAGSLSGEVLADYPKQAELFIISKTKDSKLVSVKKVYDDTGGIFNIRPLEFIQQFLRGTGGNKMGTYTQQAAEHKRRKRALAQKHPDVQAPTAIPADYIIVVKLGVPVNTLNQSSVLALRNAFADELHLPIENVGIDKIRYHGNDVEMFFVKNGHNFIIFSLDDLLPARGIANPVTLNSIKHKVPGLNITSIYSQHEIAFETYIQPNWMQNYFPYLIAACGMVLLVTTGILIYCCCRKKEKTLKETDDEIRASQKIFYPSIAPDTKNLLMIQPENDPVYIPKGCVTPIPAQPVRLVKKGLLERRGSNASLTIDLNPSLELTQRWENGTPPKESSGLEYLLSAGNRLSRRDLRNVTKNFRAIYEEFWEVPMNHPDKIYVAGSGMKNRYKTIIPNEHSRVVLPDSEWDPLSSYINANYIRGYDGEPHAYIATQGPLSHTIVDFWHMVWHEKSPIIVMITKLKEKGKSKCENYLPEDYSSSMYGDIEVKVEKLVTRNGYLVKSIVLKCKGECHYVLHYWYTSWPDHKPPDSPSKLLDLIKEVELRSSSDKSRSQGPVVVHCSAGIGRTGCFLAISIGMKQLREEQSVDVLGIICSLRVDRGGMIQTHEQYAFIHQALCEYEKELAAEPSDSSYPAD